MHSLGSSERSLTREEREMHGGEEKQGLEDGFKGSLCGPAATGD